MKDRKLNPIFIALISEYDKFKITKAFEPESMVDYILIPWWFIRWIFTWCIYQVDLIRWKTGLKTLGGRNYDWNPIVCERCLWTGPRCWAIHGYGNDGSVEDVEPVDECPRCGNEI